MPMYKHIYLYLTIYKCTYSVMYILSDYLSARATCAGILRSTREHIISIKVVRVEFLINKPLLPGKCNNYSALWIIHVVLVYDKTGGK